MTLPEIVPSADLVFQEFPSIARLSREMIVTEKIDGTNAQVYISDDGTVRAGSRNRWLTTDQDNFGFARWVQDHAENLRQLGPGRHFGEWWGQGIQRGYGLSGKVFSLFNVKRWEDRAVRPSCCLIVPVLYRGMFDTSEIDRVLSHLAACGSQAVPGFKKPEGIVVFHVAGNLLFKKTLDKNDEHKGAMPSRS